MIIEAGYDLYDLAIGRLTHPSTVGRLVLIALSSEMRLNEVHELDHPRGAPLLASAGRILDLLDPELDSHAALVHRVALAPDPAEPLDPTSWVLAQRVEERGVELLNYIVLDGTSWRASSAMYRYDRRPTADPTAKQDRRPSVPRPRRGDAVVTPMFPAASVSRTPAGA